MSMSTELLPALQRSRNQSQVSLLLQEVLLEDAAFAQLAPLFESGRIDPHRFIPDSQGQWLNVLQAFAYLNLSQRVLTDSQFYLPTQLRQIGIPWVSLDSRGLPLGNRLSPLELVLSTQSRIARPNASLVKSLILAGDRLTPHNEAWPLPVQFLPEQPDAYFVCLRELAERQIDCIHSEHAIGFISGQKALWQTLLSALSPQIQRASRTQPVWVM